MHGPLPGTYQRATRVNSSLAGIPELPADIWPWTVAWMASSSACLGSLSSSCGPLLDILGRITYALILYLQLCISSNHQIFFFQVSCTLLDDSSFRSSELRLFSEVVAD